MGGGEISWPKEVVMWGIVFEMASQRVKQVQD